MFNQNSLDDIKTFTNEFVDKMNFIWNCSNDLLVHLFFSKIENIEECPRWTNSTLNIHEKNKQNQISFIIFPDTLSRHDLIQDKIETLNSFYLQLKTLLSQENLSIQLHE